MPTRKDYISKIWMYRKRRAAMTKKISQWQNEIKRIDIKTSACSTLMQLVNEYFSVDINTRNMDTAHRLARNCYYKYGMENGFQGSYLCKSIGRNRLKTAAECRMRFQRSFKTNSANKEAYHQFLQYMKNQSNFNQQAA